MLVSVWAPRAERSVEVVLRGAGRVALAPAADGRGRWAGEVAGLRPGGDYAFSLDGGPPRPDPRSASQPYGPDGPSRVVDHAAFAWSDAGWRGVDLPTAVLYELHVGTFSPEGTFDGAIARLDHLVDLGVDAVELLPVVEFSGEWGWGYDGVDLWAPHHAYGGPDGLKRLVDACHARGLGVFLDVVYNHLGPSGNYLGRFGPYFGDRHHTNWGEAVNVDGRGSDEVRAFIVENACMWLRDYHVDGLRLDAVHAIVDDSALHVLEQMSVAVRALAAEVGRPLWLIAESDRNDPRYVRPPEVGGLGLDASWADEWHHALHAVLTGERAGYYADFGTLAQLAKALRQAWVYDGAYSPERDRTHGRSPAGLPGSAFVVSAQNHDQVGNRAAGDRLGALGVAAAAPGGGGAPAHGPVRAAAVPGRGVGRVVAVPVLHQPPRPRAGPGGLGGPAARVRPLRLEPRGRARPAGPGHVPPVEAAVGRGGLRGPRRPAGLVPGADRPAPVVAVAGLRPGRVALGAVRRGGRVAVRGAGPVHRGRQPRLVVVRAAAAGGAAGGRGAGAGVGRRRDPRRGRPGAPAGRRRGGALGPGD